MHTKDILAAELSRIGLLAMAEKARAGWYHEYLSPLGFPWQTLAADLFDVGSAEALELRRRHIKGEFDATADEREASVEFPHERND